MAEKAIGKRQKEAAVKLLLDKLIAKGKGKIYILDLEKSTNEPVCILNLNAALSLSIAYYELLTQSYKSAKAAKRLFKSLYIADLGKCAAAQDGKQERRLRADLSMLKNGSTKLKELIVDLYFSDCFKKIGSKKAVVDDVLGDAVQKDLIGLTKEDEDNIDDLELDPTDDTEEDFETSFDGDGEDHMEDDWLDEDEELEDKEVKTLGKLNSMLMPHVSVKGDKYKLPKYEAPKKGTLVELIDLMLDLILKKLLDLAADMLMPHTKVKADKYKEPKYEAPKAGKLMLAELSDNLNLSIDHFTKKINKYKKLLGV